MHPVKQEIGIPVGSLKLKGNLVVPGKANAIVVFSHGSGSSRFSPRNTYVADVLNQEGMATLLTDLLTPEEDAVYANRFDIALLTNRLVAVTRYLETQSAFQHLPLGYFGASTGAASALRAAAALPEWIHAVVSRGGRPDLASDVLPQVKAPTLLIVGGLDDVVITLNQEAFDQMRCEKKMVIVDDATHLFEEPGKLEEVAILAASWFQQYLLNNTETIQDAI